MSLQLVVDYRESKFIEYLTNYEIPYIVENLDIGDFLIKDASGENLIILERKSIADFASSIQDGRYNEQSYRLSQSSTHNHNITYIIEGNIETAKFHSSRINKQTIYSAMNSIMFLKGFTIIRTNSIIETVQYVMNIYSKLCKEFSKGKTLYYNSNNNRNLIENTQEIDNPSKYVENIKLCSVKKNNITKENIQILMLAQIPYVSSKIAQELLNYYGNLENMLKDLKDNFDDFGKKISYTTTSGKVRKIPSNVIAQIKCLL